MGAVSAAIAVADAGGSAATVFAGFAAAGPATSGPPPIPVIVVLAEVTLTAGLAAEVEGAEGIITPAWPSGGALTVALLFGGAAMDVDGSVLNVTLAVCGAVKPPRPVPAAAA